MTDNHRTNVLIVNNLMRKLKRFLKQNNNINSALLIFICLLAVAQHISFGINETVIGYKKNKNIYCGSEVNSIDFKYEKNKFCIAGIQESINTITSGNIKKNSPLKRTKNRPNYTGIFSEKNTKSILLNVDSEKSGSPFVNISYLKFLRISKMLC